MKDFSRQNFTQKPVRLVIPQAGLPAGGKLSEFSSHKGPPAPGRTFSKPLKPRLGFLVVALICSYLAGLLTAAAFGG